MRFWVGSECQEKKVDGCIVPCSHDLANLMNASTFASAHAPAIHEVGASRAVGPRAYLGESRIRRDVKSLSERFWAKVDKNGPTMPHMQTQCWVWTAGCIGDGYGRFRIRRKGTLAHRVAWLIHYGCIPDGLCVLPCLSGSHTPLIR